MGNGLKELDCLIVRQPYASLIAYGSKRWEFRNHKCQKRGTICIASSRGTPLNTGDSFLNSISKKFPRGFALAVAALKDSYVVTSQDLKEVFKGRETVRIDGYNIETAAKPLGEPVYDIQRAIKDQGWKRHAWILEDVTSLKTIIPLQNLKSGSTWTKVELVEGEPLSKSLESYF